MADVVAIDDWLEKKIAHHRKMATQYIIESKKVFDKKYPYIDFDTLYKWVDLAHKETLEIIRLEKLLKKRA